MCAQSQIPVSPVNLLCCPAASITASPVQLVSDRNNPVQLASASVSFAANILAFAATQSVDGSGA